LGAPQRQQHPWASGRARCRFEPRENKYTVANILF
jgi:hypothetical protein